MSKRIDARGKACPQPVMLAKKELDQGCHALEVLVDNPTAVQNLTRLGQSAGYTVSHTEQGGTYTVVMLGANGEPAAPPVAQAAPCSETVIFIGRDSVGDGSKELGENLMKMLLYTLSQGDPPKAILFMNGGVKIPAGEGQMVESLQSMAERGCQVLVCGTCLSYYGLTEELKVGTVSNMYEILSQMQQAQSVLSF